MPDYTYYQLTALVNDMFQLLISAIFRKYNYATEVYNISSQNMPD
jgi:hypothetical protein